MLRFPLDGLLDDQACYEFLLRILHPEGLRCPRGHLLPASQAPHRRCRPVIPDECCRQCGAVFNVFISTIFSKTSIAVPRSSKSCAASLKAHRPSIWPINWQSIARICSHDGMRYTHWWPRIFSLAAPLPNLVTEADELYQNAGVKDRKHSDPRTDNGDTFHHSTNMSRRVYAQTLMYSYRHSPLGVLVPHRLAI